MIDWNVASVGRRQLAAGGGRSTATSAAGGGTVSCYAGRRPELLCRLSTGCCAPLGPATRWGPCAMQPAELRADADPAHRIRARQ